MATPTHPEQAVDRDGHGIVDSQGRPVLQTATAAPGPAAAQQREVLVTDDGRRASGLGGALTALVALVAIVLVVLVALQALGGSDGDSILPEEIDVNVDGLEGAGDGEGGGEAPAEPAPEDAEPASEGSEPAPEG